MLCASLYGFHTPLTGKVERQLQRTRRYIVKWADGLSQEQEAYHMYGQLTRRRALRIGDHVIALADASECDVFVYNYYGQ